MFCTAADFSCLVLLLSVSVCCLPGQLLGCMVTDPPACSLQMQYEKKEGKMIGQETERKGQLQEKEEKGRGERNKRKKRAETRGGSERSGTREDYWEETREGK